MWGPEKKNIKRVEIKTFKVLERKTDDFSTKKYMIVTRENVQGSGIKGIRNLDMKNIFGILTRANIECPEMKKWRGWKQRGLVYLIEYMGTYHGINA